MIEDPVINALINCGWHVEVSGTSVSVHRLWKNGRPLKGSTVSISFEEQISDSVVSESGEIEQLNVRDRIRPWTVRAKGKTTVTYKVRELAVDKFLKWAHDLAPHE